MRISWAIGLALLTVAAGALLTTAAAHAGGMMGDWDMQGMFQACRSMMGQP